MPHMTSARSAVVQGENAPTRRPSAVNCTPFPTPRALALHRSARTHPHLTQQAENKVNLGIGAYRDENGKPWVLSCIKQVRAHHPHTPPAPLTIETAPPSVRS